MTIFRLDDVSGLAGPSLVAAFDGWVDAGSAATTAAAVLAGDGAVVATFDSDRLFDYRARRPTLEIADGHPHRLTWPELVMKRAGSGAPDLLVMTGAEPDFHWRELADAVVELAMRLGVVEWISLGAIPAAVPHTRPVPILGTESKPGLLRANVEAGPVGTLRVPAAAISVLDVAVSEAGIPTVGYFAQVPHYVSGAYPVAAAQLIHVLGEHLGREFDTGQMDVEARLLLERLDVATAADEGTKSYVERLEAMVDEARLPSGDALISEIERFLRDRGSDEAQRP